MNIYQSVSTKGFQNQYINQIQDVINIFVKVLVLDRDFYWRRTELQRRVGWKVASLDKVLFNISRYFPCPS